MCKSRTWIEPQRIEAAPISRTRKLQLENTDPNVVDVRLNPTVFRMPRCSFNFISLHFEQLCNISNVESHFHCTCARLLLRDLQTQNFAYLPPSNKSRTSIEAAPTRWKLHISRCFLTRLFSINEILIPRQKTIEIFTGEDYEKLSLRLFSIGKFSVNWIKKRTEAEMSLPHFHRNYNTVCWPSSWLA